MPFSPRARIALVVAAGLVNQTASTHAGNVWDGGGGNNNWTTGANWNFDNLPPANNGLIDVVMGGTTRLTPNVNVAYDIRGLIFNFDAGAFTLGGQELSIRAGGILQGDTQTQTVNNAIQIEASQTWDGFSGPLIVNGNVNLGGLIPHTLSISGPFGMRIDGQIEGFGTLTKFGTVGLTLGGATSNTYIGATVVNGGTLFLQKPDFITAIPTNLTIGDGTGSDAVVLLQRNQIADTANVTINSSGVLNFNTFSETIANLTINGGSVINATTLTVDDKLTVTSGTYTANGQTLSVGSMQVGVTGSAHFIQPPIFFNSVSCFGDLRVGDGASGIGQYDLHSGELGVVGTTFFGGSGTGHYLQTGGLAIVQYVVNDGSMQISGGTFSASALDGTGSVTVTDSGSLYVTRIRQSGGLSITGTNALVRIAPNGTTLALTRVGAIDLGTPGVRAITGTLNLTNNHLIVDYDGASPLPTVQQYIASGYNGGAWNGAGINTSMGNSSSFGIGYAEANDLFTTFPASYIGHSVDNTTVIVAHTRYGDANLDGVVNANDFARLATNFGLSGRVWSQGDFNYDGFVNANDFALLATNFGLAATGLNGAITPRDWANLEAVVPEPAEMSLALAAFLCGKRRIRQAR